ncbi:MAG TPA: OmpP1/FadL family transporter [Cellvibrio sp.]|nr:OmpP1/FadL family transporter [Cellvibrio sp.]
MENKTILSTLIACAGLSLPLASYAGSFQILEQSPAQLGKSFAGTASDVSDATSVFFSPAGITQLDAPSFSVGGNAIAAEAKFKDSGSNTKGITSATDETGYVPNLYLVTPISEEIAFGLGVNAPFGLASRYDNAWMGRYLATNSELEVVNLGAVLAVQINRHWSLGMGVDYQRATVTLESQVDSTLGINPSPTTDSSAIITGEDSDVSANVSFYFAPSESTSLGLVWRQGASFDMRGAARFSLNPMCSPGAGYPVGQGPAITSGTLCAGSLAALAGDVEAKVQLPSIVTLSISQQLTQHWQIHGDIAWTEWSKIQTVNIINSNNQRSVNQLQLHYDDSLRYSLGFSHSSNSPWIWRFGIGFDKAPQTAAEFTNPRIPDQDRIGLSAGFNYAFSTDVSMDVGYSYLKVDSIAIDNRDKVTGHHLRGTFAANVHLLGVQANWKF